MAAPNGPLALASIRIEGWGPAVPHREGQLEAFNCVFVCWVDGLCQMINEESNTSSGKEHGFRSDRD